jgi:hypothetical protein
LRRVLGMDVDSTVWDTTARVCEAALAVAGKKLDPEVVTTWTHVFDVYGEEKGMSILERVFSPDRVIERQPYPGAVEVIRKLRDECGIQVHFITHNDPETMTACLGGWLRSHFGPDIRLTVTYGDKLEVLREVDAFGMVDDRPDTIRRVADAGLWAATMLQPWNRDLLSERPDIHGFHTWREFPYSELRGSPAGESTPAGR